MNIGTKSILFGVHQFLWHPLTVFLAWRKLYKKWPKWPVCIAIFCHDLGYWGCPNIDDKEGKQHPFLGARIAARIIGLVMERRWVAEPFVDPGRPGLMWHFTITHSRDTAKMIGSEPSALYAADKASILFDPKPFYLLRARLSGEIKEFKTRAIASGHLPATATDGEWFDFYRDAIRNREGVKELL